MSTPFLLSFSTAVVQKLLDVGQLEIADGADAQVAIFVANYLATHGKGKSVISLMGKAILACPEVEELYADDQALKDLVQDLPPTALPRGGGR